MADISVWIDREFDCSITKKDNGVEITFASSSTPNEINKDEITLYMTQGQFEMAFARMYGAYKAFAVLHSA